MSFNVATLMLMRTFAPHQNNFTMTSFKFFQVSVIASAAMLSSCGNAPEQPPVVEAPAIVTIEMSVDTATSTIEWSGTMVGVYAHTGILKLTDGAFTVENGQVSGGSFTADLTSMEVTDQNYDVKKGNTPEKLIGHLSSPDFFDVPNHPTARFEVTGVNEEGKVTGKLTVRGVTDSEVLENLVIDADNGTASASLTFDRQKYGVAWASPMKDMVLSNEIKLNVNLKAKG
jgi:polyisoprenoid-binding protein YceI